MMDPRFPIGEFDFDAPVGAEEVAASIDAIAEHPAALRRAVEGLTDAQLDTPYRDGGWTVRQVVHHLADSHVNSYTRFRLAMTEEVPTIRPYDEKAWADLPDARSGPVDVSLRLLEALHERWAVLLRSMAPEDFQRVLHHPDLGNVPLDRNTALYAWHGHHHVAHITELRRRQGW